MEVRLIKLIYKKDDIHEYKYKPLEYCCEELKNNDHIIITYGDSADENIPQFCITYTETEEEWGEVNEYTYNSPIRYCPYCGRKIDIKVIGAINKASAYKKLIEERQLIWDRCKKTDGKIELKFKEEQKLKTKLKEIDKKINWFGKLTDWND